VARKTFVHYSHHQVTVTWKVEESENSNGMCIKYSIYCGQYAEIKGQLDATDGSLLQNLLFAKHVSGTIMPIIRGSRCSIPQTGHTAYSSTPGQQPV